MRSVRLTPIARISDVVQVWHPVHVSVGPKADPVILCSDKDLKSDVVETQNGIRVVPRSEGTVRLRIYHLLDSNWHILTLPPVERALNFIAQPYGQSNWLIVQTAIPRLSTEHNARVYDPNGHTLKTFHAGNGILDVQVGDDCLTWVTYNDVAVEADPDIRLSGSGLACFDSNGNVKFRLSDLAKQGSVPSIGMCYALNVTNDGSVWTSYYNRFPLVRISDGKLDRIWQQIPVGGSHGLAVSGNRVLLGGGYLKEKMAGSISSDNPEALAVMNQWVQQIQFRADHPQVFLIDLENIAVEMLQAVLPSGKPIGRSRFFGRDDRLYVVTDDELLGVSLSDL